MIVDGLPLNEKDNYKYIYIDKLHNEVHLLYPIASGYGVCQPFEPHQLIERRGYFDQQDRHNIFLIIEQYKQDLQSDLTRLATHPELRHIAMAKQQRLQQLEQYSEKLAHLKLAQPEINTSANAAFQALSNQHENGFSISRINTGTDYVFSTQAQNGIVTNKLINTIRDLPLHHATIKDAILNQVQQQFAGLNGSQYFDAVLNLIISQIRHYSEDPDMFIDENGYLTDHYGKPISPQYLMSCFLIDDDSSALECADAILSSSLFAFVMSQQTLPNQDISTYARSSDDIVKSVLFFLALMNIKAVQNNLSTKNFGDILENDQDFTDDLANVLRDALSTGNSLQEALFGFIHERFYSFGLEREFNADEQRGIIQLFHTLFPMQSQLQQPELALLIHDASHPGAFVQFRGYICVSVADIYLQCLPEVDDKFMKRQAARFRQLFPKHFVDGHLIHKDFSEETLKLARQFIGDVYAVNPGLQDATQNPFVDLPVHLLLEIFKQLAAETLPKSEISYISATGSQRFFDMVNEVREQAQQVVDHRADEAPQTQDDLSLKPSHTLT